VRQLTVESKVTNLPPLESSRVAISGARAAECAIQTALLEHVLRKTLKSGRAQPLPSPFRRERRRESQVQPLRALLGSSFRSPSATLDLGIC
jgi:hypothetical protein